MQQHQNVHFALPPTEAQIRRRFVASVAVLRLACQVARVAKDRTAKSDAEFGSKIRRPAGVSCGSCLFIVVLSV